MARIRFSPSGEPNSNCFKFLAKIAMAVSSAFFLAAPKISFDKAGNNSRLYESEIAFSICSAQTPLDRMSLFSIRSSIFSSSISIFTRIKPSASARKIANNR